MFKYEKPFESENALMFLKYGLELEPHQRPWHLNGTADRRFDNQPHDRLARF